MVCFTCNPCTDLSLEFLGFPIVEDKEDTDTGTNSHIRRLMDEERVGEIAHMLSGATLTDAALNNAKALLGIV